MMKQEDFIVLINNLMEVNERSLKLHFHYKINICDYEEQYHDIINLLIKNTFTPEGVDWIDWYIYDRVGIGGNINEATETKDGVKINICYDVPSLYDYLTKNKYFKI